MDGVNLSKEIAAERSFNPSIDLAPIELIFIGGTDNLPDGTLFSAIELKKNPKLRSSKVLLQPFGMINSKSIREEIQSNREKQEKLVGWFNCFKASREVRKAYNLEYFLASPDSTDNIPNLFRFKMTNDSHSWSSSNKDDIDALEEIRLIDGLLPKGENESPLFSLSKDMNTGVITLVFLPLQGNIKQ